MLIKKILPTQKVLNLYNKNYLVITKCNRNESMSTSDSTLCLDVNFGKILLDTSKLKKLNLQLYNVYNGSVHTTCFISKRYYVLLLLLNLFFANSTTISFAAVNFFSNER